mgnify:CR=1 FL=1
MDKKERLMYLLALIKVDVETSEHLYTLMDELNIDSRKVDELRYDLESDDLERKIIEREIIFFGGYENESKI